jgi:hypothetical protein
LARVNGTLGQFQQLTKGEIVLATVTLGAAWPPKIPSGFPVGFWWSNRNPVVKPFADDCVNGDIDIPLEGGHSL